MTIWTVLLVVSGGAFAVMLVVVGYGAVGELRESLQELRGDTEESAAHPDVLEKPV